MVYIFFFFFSSRRRHTRSLRDWSSDVCSSDLKECGRLIERKLPLPAYEQCIKASHCFNMLDARGVISVTERQSYILRVRELAKASCEAWLASQLETV